MSDADSKPSRKYTYAKSCEWCDSPFTTHRKAARFCGIGCSSQWNSERVLSTRKDCQCGWCGKAFKLNPKSKRAGKFCSRDCSFSSKGRIKAEKEALLRIREAWNGGVTPDAKKPSLTLKKLFAHLAWQIKRLRVGRAFQNHCPDCGCETTVTVGKVSTQRCKACNRRRNPPDPNCPYRKAARRKAKAARKALIRGASYAEQIDPTAVLRRYGWRCYLCGIDTPRWLRGLNEPNSPEVDHVMPLSRGGAHTWENLACICHSCNGKKSNMTLSEFFERG